MRETDGTTTLPRAYDSSEASLKRRETVNSKEFDDPKSLMVSKQFQMKVWTLMIQRNSMIPKSLVIQKTSIGSIDFDNPKVCGDTSIFYGLVLNTETMN